MSFGPDPNQAGGLVTSGMGGFNPSSNDSAGGDSASSGPSCQAPPSNGTGNGGSNGPGNGGSGGGNPGPGGTGGGDSPGQGGGDNSGGDGHNPPAVPGTGTPLQVILETRSRPPFGGTVANLLVTCKTTGGSVQAVCGQPTMFYFDPKITLADFTTPAGNGHSCSFGGDEAYLASEGSTPIPAPGNVFDLFINPVNP